MAQKRNLFTTYGTLRASVIDALDLIDASQNKNKSLKTKCKVFAVLKVVDDAGNEIKHFNTETHPYYTSETTIIGEEFIFENVSSVHCLLLSFYSLSGEKAPSGEMVMSQSCLGFTKIPVSRLEENRPVLDLLNFVDNSC